MVRCMMTVLLRAAILCKMLAQPFSTHANVVYQASELWQDVLADADAVHDSSKHLCNAG